MKGVSADSKCFLVGVPLFQFVRKGSGAGRRWRPPLQQRRRRAMSRCQYREGWNPVPEKDTRIHWSSPDEGWIGVEDPSPSSGSSTSSLIEDLLSSFNSPKDSYYEFLGIRPDADVEGIKAAYRKLSKMYHPDSTSLPSDEAAKKFLMLQQAYEILSSSEERKIYDWSLAQQISNQEGRGFVWPYEAEETLKRSGFETEAAGKKKQNDGYYEFSGQQVAGLTFDVFAFLFAISVALYVAVFKNQ